MTSLYGTGTAPSGSGLFAYYTVDNNWPDWVSPARVDFTSGAALDSDIAACICGNLHLLAFGSRNMAETAPTVAEFVHSADASESQANRIRLVVD